jgi:hypothetical protein
MEKMTRKNSSNQESKLDAELARIQRTLFIKRSALRALIVNGYDPAELTGEITILERKEVAVQKAVQI